ncbi:MAG: A24 family peptidase [Planctomycetota bacterium]
MQLAEVFQAVASGLLFLVLAVSATTDLLRRKIYNVVTYPAICLGLALGFGAGGLGDSLWGHTLLGHLAGFLLGFMLLFVAYWSRAVGGGEVKLAAAIGAVYGFPFIIPALFWSSLAGFVMAIWVLIWRAKLLTGLKRSVRYAVSLKGELPEPDDPAAIKLPYGVAMAFGTFFAWFLQEVA